MTMNITEQIIIFAVVMAGTMATRFLPFMLFPANKPTPEYIKYLGDVLPPAVLGMLVIYCIKNVNILAGNRGMPEFIAIIFVIMLHIWKRKMLLSISAGTITYMILVQFVF